jgi:glycosyltransferase involved in cell wall biosynthesis
MFQLMEKQLGWEPDRELLGCDVSAARRLLIGRDEVVHLLYSESDLFYAGRLRGLGHLRGNRLVCTFHFPPSELEDRPPGSFDFDRIDAAVALGGQQADYLRGKVGTGRVFRASHGVDIRAWQPAPSRRSSTPTCVFVGFWLRDFSMLEDVVRQVLRENPAVRFELVTDRRHLESLRARDGYQPLLAQPNVRVLTGISDAQLRSAYQRAWLHVLPLRDAVANNALLEGMACGLPTVTTAVGDVLDYTTDRSAICVASGDTTGMANAVLGLLEDSELRESFGRAAREKAETISLEEVARRHADIYCELANRRRFGVRNGMRSRET